LGGMQYNKTNRTKPLDPNSEFVKLLNEHAQYVTDEISKLKLSLESVEDNTRSIVESRIENCSNIFVTKKVIRRLIYVTILILIALVKLSSDIGSAVNTALHDREMLIKTEIKQLHEDNTAQYQLIRKEFNERLQAELNKRSVIDRQILNRLNTLADENKHGRTTNNESH